MSSPCPCLGAWFEARQDCRDPRQEGRCGIWATVQSLELGMDGQCGSRGTRMGSGMRHRSLMPLISWASYLTFSSSVFSSKNWRCSQHLIHGACGKDCETMDIEGLAYIILEDGSLCIWERKPNWQVYASRGNQVVSERNLSGHRLPNFGATPCN